MPSRRLRAVALALGANFGPPGRRLGLDPGNFVLGANDVVGPGLQGFRVNFGDPF